MRRISRRSSHTSVGNKALNSAAPARGSSSTSGTSITSLIICRPLLGRSISEGRSRGHFFQRHEGFGKHLTAVDDKRLAGDVGCLLARKEECRVRYVFCGSEPPHRDRRLHFRDVRRPKSAQSFGRYVPALMALRVHNGFSRTVSPRGERGGGG